MNLARVRRVLMLIGAILIFLILAGATYQGVATAFERRRFPYPGRLVDVGGHQLHLYCSGQGSPTVVLEAPAAAMSAAWGGVQPTLATRTRVCSYDRAGLGWSEAGDTGFNPAAVPAELDLLLQHAGEQPPYVLAGEGFGAALARLDAEHLGNRVAALVLIDAPVDADGPGVDDFQRLRVSPWLARAGLLRVTGTLAKKVAGLPESSARITTAFLSRPDHLTRSAMELRRWREVIERSTRARLPATVRVSEVEAMGTPGMAFLTNSAAVSRATTAVIAAIDDVRKEH